MSWLGGQVRSFKLGNPGFGGRGFPTSQCVRVCGGSRLWGLLTSGEGRKASPVPLLLVLWPESSWEDTFVSPFH